MARTRERARALVQETLQRVNVPSFVGDDDGRILWLNDAAKDAFGDRAGESYTTVVAPEDVGRFAAEIERLRSGAAKSDYEIHVLLRDGRRRRVEISAVPISDAVCHGIFGVVQRPGSRLVADGTSPLTRRQQDVLELLATGHSTKQIAATLHLSPDTVRGHTRNLLRALGTH